MARLIAFSVLFFALSCCPEAEVQKEDFSPADYVNPMIGASTSTDAAGVYHGLGKTFPGATTPYGMVQVSPNTITGGDNAPGYSNEHKTIEGFAMTHMSGVGWFGEMGNLLVMPTTGKMHTIAGREDGSIEGWRSAYDKTSEVAKAGYYSVQLTDYNIGVETSATPHCGIMRFTYPASELSRLQIDLARRIGGTAEVESVKLEDEKTISGWLRCVPETGGWGNGEGNVSYTLYFYAQLSRSWGESGVWSADIPDTWQRKRDEVVSKPYLERVAQAEILRGVKQAEGKHIGFFGEFPTTEGEVVELKIGISYVDAEGAKRNFEQEIADKTFDQVRNEARESWNRELSKITIEGGTEEQNVVFYTSLYHTMIDPRICADVDGRYVGGDGKVHQGEESFTKRTIFSGWDIFRSQMPLQTIINPDVVNDIICSLTEMAESSGREYYERWELLNAYSGCMLGNPANVVVADAYAKGIRGYDAKKALQYAINSSAKFGNDALGYTPSDLCISHTLEYAHADWCVARLAECLGEEAVAAAFDRKAEAWRNIFCQEKGWFRPRKANGEWAAWIPEARTTEWYGCMESTPYQQGWFVPHNIEGLAELLGGREAMVADLRNFFEKAPQDMHWNEYYNHANEPVHHVPFIFNRLGEPSLTQYWTRLICRNAYTNKVEGLVGNEDAGQMSAWYVLASSGLHPVCPGDTRMEITSPVFSRITFALNTKYAAGESFTVVAHDNSEENIYIQRAELNGKPYDECYIDFSDIAAGGELHLYMGAEPTDWGKE